MKIGRIATVETTILEMPYTKPLVTATNHFTVARGLLVKVITEGGIEGYGYSDLFPRTGETPQTAQHVIESVLKTKVLGKDLEEQTLPFFGNLPSAVCTSEVLPYRRSEKTNSFSLFSMARSTSATSFSRLQKAFPLTTPPYSKGFFIVRNLRYATCVIPKTPPVKRILSCGLPEKTPLIFPEKRDGPKSQKGLPEHPALSLVHDFRRISYDQRAGRSLEAKS